MRGNYEVEGIDNPRLRGRKLQCGARLVDRVTKELIIPDSGDGNPPLSLPQRFVATKELIIPDSGDGNRAGHGYFMLLL